MSFDNFVNFYSNSRNPSPTKQLENSTSPVESPQTRVATSTAVVSPKETSSSGLQNSLSQPSSGFSLASAKQRAKGVFTTRRKGSQSDFEMMKKTQEVYMDSREYSGSVILKCGNDINADFRRLKPQYLAALPYIRKQRPRLVGEIMRLVKF